MAFRNIDRQLSFLERPEVEAAVAGMADSGAETRGAAFTRREVVDFILDLADYTVDKPLRRDNQDDEPATIRMTLRRAGAPKGGRSPS